jgi:hypothetical protein
VVVAVLAIVLGGRAWRQFTSPDLKFPNSAASHFTDVEGAGRYDYWRVAIKGFDQNPIAGNGAGTYQFLWDRYRKIRVPVGTPNTVTTARDAHSLYIETLAELGIIGALLVLGLVGSVLFIGFSAWRHAPGEEREGAAALFAVVVAFAVAAGFDWLWEVADVGAVFFLAAGVLTALACSERDPRPARPGNGQRRYGLAVAGVVIGWITVVALIGPLIVDRELASSRAALARGDLSSAQDHAQTARDVEPWAASPYVQLDLVAEAKRDYATARERISEAIDREPDNWQLWVIRSRVEKAAGLESAARRDENRAEQLNPFASDVIRQTIRATKAPARG